MNYSFIGNPLTIWVLFFSGLLVFFYLIKKFKKNGLKYLKQFFKNKNLPVSEPVLGFIDGYGIPLLYGVAFYLNFGFLNLTSYLEKAYHIFGQILFISTIMLLSTSIIDWLLKQNLKKKDLKPAIKTAMPGFSKIIKISLWIIATIFFLENLGFHISTLVAGLGIGGIAIAFASQIILKDLFSYISILLDQPFAVGDFIIVGEFLGSIEHIGIKTTRIRSLSGELLVFSNTDLTESRLRNYQLMKERRVVFQIGVVYDTPSDKVKAIPDMIKNIILNIPDTRFDRAHFSSYGDFSLVYEIVYYILSSDYNKYMDIQQTINFAIKEEFEKNTIEFAFPTQTLYLKRN